MKTAPRHNDRPRLTEKGKSVLAVSGLLGAVVVGGLVHHELTKPSPEEQRLTALLSQKNLIDQFDGPEASPLSPDEVVIYKAQANDTPTTIAAAFGANSVKHVKNEIIGQIGGDAGDLQQGANIVLYKGEIDPNMYAYETVNGKPTGDPLVNEAGVHYAAPTDVIRADAG